MTTQQNDDYDERIALSQRIQKALSPHHYPDSTAVQRARDRLRQALEREPAHRTDAAAIRYHRRIIEQFDRAVERDARFIAR